MTLFKKILIANRGEIAVRIIKTATAMGYSTVAVYSEADQDALHVQLADQSVLIGPAPVAESYLNAESIIAAAKSSGADAIHPGYGFLSENSAFAKLCLDNQIIFIGPSAHAIELMGSKRQSKIAVQNANVATVPGYDGENQSIAALTREAKRIGTPLMIKASAGGGGRGMRLVTDLSTLSEHLSSAASEAENAFGSGELILEKALIKPRHIEIQIFADQQGNAISLGERDCSVQRRHQKVVEEAPSPAVNPTLRKAMGEAAIQVATLCDYTGAGTVEFLLDQSGDFFFLEMNTRLQVEHPVTEQVTGIDLVEWQLRIAAGEPLPLTQDQIQIKGHAIEVRLYAEDPCNDYLPQTGPIHLWQIPDDDNVRVDSGILQGTQISPFYDPMLAKIIAFSNDRQGAIRKLDRALSHTCLLGTKTNKYFLRDMINHPEFRSGQVTTDFIAQNQAQLLATNVLSDNEADSFAHALAVALWVYSHTPQPCRHQDRLSGRMGSIVFLRHNNRDKNKTVVRCRVHYLSAQCLRVNVNDMSFDLNIKILGDRFHVRHDTNTHSGTLFIQERSLFFDTGEQSYHFINATHELPHKPEAEGNGRILSPMDGNLMSVQVSPGDSVSKGDTVAVVEAMKMEHQLKADVDGIVETVSAQAGDQLKTRQLILLIKREINQNQT